MKRTQAEKLLGGYATGTLTDAERQALFTAALDHQEVFDALMDEEVLRELLADPAAKAQLLAALSPRQPLRADPFWLRSVVLGAAAGLIVAVTAGLAFRRSLERTPPQLRQEQEKPAAPKAVETAPAPPSTVRPAQKAPPLQTAVQPTAPEAAANRPAPAPAPLESAPAAAPVPVAGAYRAQSTTPREKALEEAAKKVEAPRSAGAAPEMAGSVAPAARAKAADADRMAARRAFRAPTWTLEAQADGRTLVTVTALPRPQVVLLRRGTAGVEVLKLQSSEVPGGALLQWRAEVRLGPGDVLDLYLLDRPVADPARLPDTGPVDGFLARIHPAARKEPPR